MLRRVEIQNYKSCRSVVLDGLTPLTALVGRNGAGKTNVLQAIATAARTASQPTASYEPFFWVNPDLRISLAFSVAATEYRYTIAHPSAAPPAQPGQPADLEVMAGEAGAPSMFELLEARGPSAQTWRQLLERRGEVVTLSPESPLRIGRSTAALPALHAMLASSHPAIEGIEEARSFLRGVRYYELDADADEDSQASPFISGRAYAEWRQAYDAGDRPGPTTLKVLQLSIAMAERFEELQALIGSKGLELLDGVDVSKVPSRAQFPYVPVEIEWHMQFAVSGGRFSFHDLSAGTRRIVSLLASLLLDDSSVLLIEHPEDTVHAGLARKLLGVLRAYADPATIVLTTHSTTVMDELKPDECRLVAMSDGSTTVRALSSDELGAARAYLEDTGSLSDFLETAEQD